MYRVYLLPGLGANYKLFDRVQSLDYDFVVLDWIVPRPGETMAGYAGRLAERIGPTAPFALVGVSFGGMVAVELAKIVKPRKVILISSAKDRTEIPWYFKIFRFVRLHKVLTENVIKRLALMTGPLFGKPVRMTRGERDLFKEMLDAANYDFIRWALDAVVTWDNTDPPAGVIHLHGDRDRILPIRYIKNPVTIQGGNHYMILTQFDAVRERVREYLKG